MNLSIIDQKLQIEFSFWEQLWSVRLNKVWQIPLNHIIQAHTNPPESNWKEVRAPGTFVPGIIKAGTYYTDKGKEFWYVSKNNGFHHFLTIELENESYKRIILSNIYNNEEWQQRLNPAI